MPKGDNFKGKRHPNAGIKKGGTHDKFKFCLRKAFDEALNPETGYIAIEEIIKTTYQSKPEVVLQTLAKLAPQKSENLNNNLHQIAPISESDKEILRNALGLNND